MRFKKFLVIFLFIISLNIFHSSRLMSSSIINFEFYTYKGEKYNLQNFRGKYILLNLFTTYCPTCIVELNTLNKLNNICKSDNLKEFGFNPHIESEEYTIDGLVDAIKNYFSKIGGKK